MLDAYRCTHCGLFCGGGINCPNYGQKGEPLLADLPDGILDIADGPATTADPLDCEALPERAGPTLTQVWEAISGLGDCLEREATLSAAMERALPPIPAYTPPLPSPSSVSVAEIARLRDDLRGTLANVQFVQAKLGEAIVEMTALGESLSATARRMREALAR